MAMPLASAGNSGSASVQPSGSRRCDIRSKSARPRRCPSAQASNDCCHSACAARPRSTTSRACASTLGSTSKVFDGSKPSSFLVAATSSSPRALPCALPVFCAFGAGQAMTVRSAMKDGRSVSASRGVEGAGEGGDVLLVAPSSRAPVDALHVPAVRLVAGRGVLGERDRGVVLDGDVVLVVDQRQVAEPLGAGERGRLAADALLDVAVGGDAPDVVVEGALAGCRVRVEEAALPAGGHRHADRVADALAERAGGGLDAGGVAVLGVPGGQRAPGPQRPEVVELEAVAGQVELDVERQARVAGRQDEPVTAGPARVGRVVAQVALEEQVRRRGQAHGGPGVPVADLLHGVHREDAHGVDGLLVQLGPLELLLGAHGRQGSFDEWLGRPGWGSGVLEDGLQAVRDLISPERTHGGPVAPSPFRAGGYSGAAPDHPSETAARGPSGTSPGTTERGSA